MASELSDSYKEYVNTDEYKTGVKDYMILTRIIMDMCNANEAEPLYQHY